MAIAYFISLMGLDHVMQVELSSPHSAKLASLAPDTRKKIEVELEEAQAAVHLAMTLVQWFISGAASARR